MTYREYNHDLRNGGNAAYEFIESLISPAPKEFMRKSAEEIFGDANGKFEDKYGHDADDQVNPRAIQQDLTRELGELEKAR